MSVPDYIELRIIQILIDQCAKANVSIPDYRFFTDAEFLKRHAPIKTKYGNVAAIGYYSGIRTLYLNYKIFDYEEKARERVLLHELAHHIISKKGLIRKGMDLRACGQAENDRWHGQEFVNVLMELYCAHDKDLMEHTYCLDGYDWTSRMLKRLKGTPAYRRFVKRLGKKRKNT